MFLHATDLLRSKTEIFNDFNTLRVWRCTTQIDFTYLELVFGLSFAGLTSSLVSVLHVGLIRLLVGFDALHTHTHGQLACLELVFRLCFAALTSSLVSVLHVG